MIYAIIRNTTPTGNTFKVGCRVGTALKDDTHEYGIVYIGQSNKKSLEDIHTYHRTNSEEQNELVRRFATLDDSEVINLSKRYLGVDDIDTIVAMYPNAKLVCKPFSIDV